MSLNKVIICGRLGHDPETKYTASGVAVTNLNIATSERFKDKSGNQQEKTEWHRAVVWGKQAEHCAQYLSKGREVLVEGKLETRSWKAKDGSKRFATEIKASSVQFLGGGSSGKDESSGGGFNFDDMKVNTDDSFTADEIPF